MSKIAPFSIGTRFGDWEVVEQIERAVSGKGGQAVAYCSRVVCVCGVERVVNNNYLRTGHTNGCGCRRSRAFRGKTKHDKSRTSAYKLWASIKGRLQRDLSYHDVSMYGPWVEDFSAFAEFIESLGPKPTPEHTLDRKNPAGDYAPGNLRWADKSTQSANRRYPRRTVEVGKKFDMLTVLQVSIEERYDTRWAMVTVRCDCGTVKKIDQQQLFSPKTKSCGCFKNQNLKLGHLAIEKPIEAHGRSMSMSAWARELGVSRHVIWTRIHKYGWDPVRAVTEPLHEDPLIEVNSEKLTAAEWSKRHGVPTRIIAKRIKEGWDPTDAVSAPVRPWKKKRLDS